MFPYLGLKASTDEAQLEERLQHQPEVFEFYTQASDMTPDGLAHLSQMIDRVKSAGVDHVIIHHPMAFDHAHNELAVSALRNPASYQFMMGSTESIIELAKAKDVQVLVHGAYNAPLSWIKAQFGSLEAGRELVFDRLDYFKALGGNHVMFENALSPLFRFGEPGFERRIMGHHYRLAYDISHAFIVLHGDNDKLVSSLARLAPQIVHYHLVDSMGQKHDSLPLGQGNIDWVRVKRVLNPNATNIYEITLDDEDNCQAMLDSHNYLKSLDSRSLLVGR